MDQNWRDVLTTMIQVGGGLVSGYVLAWFAISRSDRLEQKRWNREDRHRYSVDRRQCYVRFSSLCLESMNLILGNRRAELAGREMVAPREGFTNEYYAAFAEIRMVGSLPIVEAAVAVNERIDEEAEAAESGASLDLVQSARNVAAESLREFARLARLDLGVGDTEEAGHPPAPSSGAS